MIYLIFCIDRISNYDSVIWFSVQTNYENAIEERGTASEELNEKDLQLFERLLGAEVTATSLCEVSSFIFFPPSPSAEFLSLSSSFPIFKG